MTASIIEERDDVEGRRKFALLARGDFDFALFRIVNTIIDHTRTEARPFR